MNIESVDNFFKGNSTISFIYSPGGRLDDFAERQKLALDELKRTRSEHPSGSDPERKPPSFDFGDRHTVRGMLIGGISGAIGGGLFGFFVQLPAAGFIGGLLLGAFIGAMIGDFIRKRRLRNKNLGVTEEKRPDLSGPFKKA